MTSRLRAIWPVQSNRKTVVILARVFQDVGTCPTVHGRESQEVLFFVLMVLTIVSFSYHLNAKVQLDVKNQVSEADLGAARPLLHKTCDAVVELDSSMRIVEEAEELNAILQSGGSLATSSRAETRSDSHSSWGLQTTETRLPGTFAQKSSIHKAKRSTWSSTA